MEDLEEQFLMRAVLDKQDDNGDTFLHHEFKNDNEFISIVKFLRAGGNPHLRNRKGRLSLHDAAKYSPLCARAIELLLAYGVGVNSTDDEGTSILHDALQNICINLEMVKCLLNAKANPNLRNIRNIPPLGYVKNSSLSDSDKLLVELLLIKYSVIKMFEDYNFDSDDEVDPDEILCLHFCRDKDKRKEYADSRDSCIQEVLKMAKDKIAEDVTFFQLIYGHYFGDEIKLNRSSVKKATSQLDQNEYPNYEKMLRLAVKCGSKK